MFTAPRLLFFLPICTNYKLDSQPHHALSATLGAGSKPGSTNLSCFKLSDFQLYGLFELRSSAEHLGSLSGKHVQ